MKKEILGTSDVWSMSHLSNQTSEPVYYIVDFGFQSSVVQGHGQKPYSKVMERNRFQVKPQGLPGIF